MGKNKIATKTDILRYKIAKEVFGEIEDSDGITEIPSWQIFEKTLELYKENTILKKALELAVNDKCDFENGYYGLLLETENVKVSVPKREQFYIEQAKESIDDSK